MSVRIKANYFMEATSLNLCTKIPKNDLRPHDTMNTRTITGRTVHSRGNLKSVQFQLTVGKQNGGLWVVYSLRNLDKNLDKMRIAHKKNFDLRSLKRT